MPAVFPPSLPPLADAGEFSGQTNGGKIRTSMSYGAPKVRSRTRSAPKPRRMGSRHYSRADLNTLLDFFETTLSGGVLTFDMTDPVTDTTRTFRFVDEISYRPRNRLRFTVTANLEIIG